MLFSDDGSQIPRVTPEEARRRMAEGGFLVCAYDDAQKWVDEHPKGSIPLASLKLKERALEKDALITFYCA